MTSRGLGGYLVLRAALRATHSDNPHSLPSPLLCFASKISPTSVETNHFGLFSSLLRGASYWPYLGLKTQLRCQEVFHAPGCSCASSDPYIALPGFAVRPSGANAAPIDVVSVTTRHIPVHLFSTLIPSDLHFELASCCGKGARRGQPSKLIETSVRTDQVHVHGLLGVPSLGVLRAERRLRLLLAADAAFQAPASVKCSIFCDLRMDAFAEGRVQFVVQ
jgi:hypothetical protein